MPLYRLGMQPIAPTAGQRAWQHLELGFFCHFGINTFHAKEWSDGTLPASSFNPGNLDAAQWVRVAKDAGAKYFVLTAKHHDGFCLWPTSTTDYSVASSPWRQGNGDVVAEVAAACAEADMPLGLYLSPWDRNAQCYDDPPAYDAFYREQLRELCTNYGPLVELWFDGAGSQDRTFDWDGVSAIIDELQPQAMVFNMGRPTIRWVGNENGVAADPVNYVVDRTDFSSYTVKTVALDEALYLPPECDVSLRRGWFWAAGDEPKSLEHLLAIYYASVGMGANLLLNVPPNDHGLIDASDAQRLQEWRTEIDRRFAEPVEASLEGGEGEWVATFPEPVRIDHLELAEDYDDGQRVEHHEVLTATLDDPAEHVLIRAQTIGHKRVHSFAPATLRQVRIRVQGDSPRLRSVRGYFAGAGDPGMIEYSAPTTAPPD